MINYRLATLKDNEQLLYLTRSTGMSGNMGLRIDRFPNFFDLTSLRGKTHVFVAEEDDEIVGCISVSDQLFYVENEKHPLYYISDFRVAKNHRKKGIGLQLTNEVVKYLDKNKADFAFLNVSKGNKRPFVFFSNRGDYPDFENIGTFETYEFVGSKRQKSVKGLSIEVVEESAELIDFFNAFYSKHQLARVISAEELKNTKLVVVRKANNIVGAMALVDTMGMKQNVLLKIPVHLKVGVFIINGLAKLMGWSALPKEFEPVKMLYIRYLAVPDYNKQIISLLISNAKKQAYQKGYSFVSIGFHQRDPIIKKLPKVLKFTFYSVGMLVSMKRSDHLMQKIRNGVPYIDYSII
ncbi:GNAT family N-acetyltransferase [Flagellimonas sp. GZD32]|uniref:GNAT family N-acetyltransferase n=1 Tax=Flagellimonas cixiensis TaxID=3228750 RepID=UPI0035C87F3A